jgi:sugar lactone lactonase YvrE
VILDGVGNLYVADQGNNTIRKITPDGRVSTLAGTAGQPGSTNGAGNAALFFSPTALAVDSATNLFVTDRGNGTIRKITPDGVVSTLAGMAGQFGSTDGAGSAARFSGPTGLAIDAAGNLYVADSNNNTIRKVSPDGVVSTLAGTAGQSGSTDGLGSVALLDNPAGLAIASSGTLYLADRANQTIRMVTADGMVTTIAGAPAKTGSADGLGPAARFNNPFAVAVDASGVLYVSDQFNNRVTKGIPAFLRFDGLAISQGSIQLQLTGPPTGMAVIEGSINLQSWLPLQTNALTAGELQLNVPLGSNQHQFFRARLAP